MEPEDFDMKARQANEETFPPFEIEAWDKMELLLDKHLPQQKKKRRFFFWWFAALIPVALIGGYFLFNNTNNKIHPVARQNNSISKPNTNTTTTQSNNPSSAQPAEVPNNQNNINHNAEISKTNSPEFKDSTNNTVNNNKKEEQNRLVPSLTTFNKITSKKAVDRNITPLNVNSTVKTKTENNQSSFSPQLSIAPPSKEKDIIVDEHFKTQISTPDNIGASKEKDVAASTQIKNTITGKENSKSLPQVNDTSAITMENSSVKSNANTLAKKKTTKNNFYVTLTSGLEVSGTSLSNLGVLKPVYGAGLQYSPGKLFLRTGVLFTRKVYTAKDKDYNRKTGTWMSAVTFDNINANCKVIEIPLAIGYKISNNIKTGFYVTAGTSAYFMKKEDYQFYFKNASGSDTTRGASFTNNSNHFFSSINVSAGIEQKVNGRLSLTAEPTIQIPIGGIGFGKVKLYSAGVLFTAKFRLK